MADLKNLNVETIDKTAFSVGTRHSWITDELKDTALKIVAKIKETNEPLQIDITEFYKAHRSDAGEKQIKYINYYCRKRLLEQFDAMKIKADVRTANGKLKIDLNLSKKEK